MNEYILTLFDSLWSQRIDEEDFKKQFFLDTGMSINEDFCIAKLEEGLTNHDKDTIDIFVQLGFMTKFTEKSIPVMCKLLCSPCHHKHEDIANFFKDLAATETLNCLFEATEIQFEYLNYDDTYQFARKCIKAIAAIQSKDAIEKLLLLGSSKKLIIAEYAMKELNKRKHVHL